MLGPTPYLCFDTSTIAGCLSGDSPFKAVDFSSGYFHLEDFEDGALGGTDALGVTAAHVTGVLNSGGARDSVDEDEGLIDNSGAAGSTWAQGIETFSFDEGVLGSLPTHVGIVATDLLSAATIDFFGPDMVLLGSIGPIDLGFNGVGESETSADRFFGWIDNGGIKAIRVEGGGDCFTCAEWDHLQYGSTRGPTPITIDWVTVDAPGNAGDPQETCNECGPGSTFGAVSYSYRIGKYEVTNAQYAKFLNAVARTDTNALYHADMGSVSVYGGITQSGSPGSHSYTTIAGRENMPVNFVSFWDATRFANWLHNGQPAGAQDNSTTEDGAYTLTPSGITDNTVTRNAGAAVFVTSEDEWFKAAYYDPGAMIYYNYPVGTDTRTTCESPGPNSNSANCYHFSNPLGPYDVGSYTGSPSPFGTFDQGGNIWELTEAIMNDLSENPTYRAKRGGNFHFRAQDGLIVTKRNSSHAASHSDGGGFRVASPVPEPSAVVLLSVGASVLKLLQRARRRRR